jgi:hypothetical protein
MSVIVGVDNNATINPSSSSDFKIVAAHIKKSAKKKSIFLRIISKLKRFLKK